MKEVKEKVKKKPELTADELTTKKKELEKRVDELSKALHEKTFSIEIESKNFLTKLIKNIENNYKWKHAELMGYVMLCNNLKEEKKNSENEKSIQLRTANVATFYKILVQYSGKGIYEAKEHLKLLTVLGESVSNAMKKIEENNQEIRDAHTELNEVETALTAKEEGIKIATNETT